MDIINTINQPSDIPTNLKKRGTVYRNKTNLVKKLEDDYLERNTGLVDLSSTLTQELLVQLLIEGSPKAFVELFELTQAVEEKNEGEDEYDRLQRLKASTLDPTVWKEFLCNKEKMTSMKNLLQAIEIASKNGPLEDLFTAQFQVGNMFDEVGDIEKSVFYYSSSLTIAVQMGDQGKESQAKLFLGKAYRRMNQHMEALKCFEDFYATASSNNDDQGIADVAEPLLDVYVTLAEEADKAGELQTSIAFYNKCLALAALRENVRVAADAKYKLGLLHFRLDQPLVAMDYQADFLSYCTSVDDNVGQTKGHAAIAEVFAVLGNVGGEIHHLESLLGTSKVLDKATEARAYCKLGMAYTRHEKHQYATTYFEQYYKLACELQDVEMIASAKINLGLTRCGALMEQEQTETIVEQEQSGVFGEQEQTEAVVEQEQTESEAFVEQQEQIEAFVEQQEQIEAFVEQQEQIEVFVEQDQTEVFVEHEQITEAPAKQQETEAFVEQEQTEGLVEQQQTGAFAEHGQPDATVQQEQTEFETF